MLEFKECSRPVNRHPVESKRSTTKMELRLVVNNDGALHNRVCEAEETNILAREELAIAVIEAWRGGNVIPLSQLGLEEGAYREALDTLSLHPAGADGEAYFGALSTNGRGQALLQGESYLRALEIESKVVAEILDALKGGRAAIVPVPQSERRGLSSAE
ncbi:hypothetical protein XH79_06995 [Bradyrhizobium sp. CCBAU 45389]|nr:hypothetical protein [Bradyrhizobium sp. CCBAU 45389]